MSDEAPKFDPNGTMEELKKWKAWAEPRFLAEKLVPGIYNAMIVSPAFEMASYPAVAAAAYDAALILAEKIIAERPKTSA